MKLRRIAILLAALGVVVALETVLTRHLIRDDAGVAPTATAEPTEAPGTGQTEQTTPLPLTTLPPVAPGYTSPPAYDPNASNNGSSTQAPAATKAPAPTQAPTAPPVPTQAPTEPPTGSAGSTLSSGSFSSDTGAGLNMSVSWTATALGDGKARISITGSVNSYSLQVMGLPISISFGNYSASVTGNSINVPNDTLSSNSLFSTSIDVDSGAAGTMTVTWQYNGEYSGISIADVTASGYVYT